MTETPTSEVADAILQVLSPGQAKAVSDLRRACGELLGRTVKELTVRRRAQELVKAGVLFVAQEGPRPVQGGRMRMVFGRKKGRKA